MRFTYKGKQYVTIPDIPSTVNTRGTLHKQQSTITTRRCDTKPRRNAPVHDQNLVANLGTRYEQTKKIRLNLKRLYKQLKRRPDKAEFLNTRIDNAIDCLKQIEARGKR